jgi:large subunit ribosomal protein L9
MKVILLTELRGKGGEGDVVEVAQGYAENFLFPNKIAVKATPGNMKQLDERRNTIAKREEKRIADANALRDQLNEKVVVVDAKVGEEGQLFGSVTAALIADAIKDQLGIEVDRKRVELNKPIKVAGLHTVDINLYREIFASVGVQVGAPAELEAEATEAPAEEELVVEAETPEVVAEEVVEAAE